MMGKVNQLSAIEKSHQRIYDCHRELDGKPLVWHVSLGALQYFQMMWEYEEVDLFHQLYQRTPRELRGMLLLNGSHLVMVNDSLSPRHAQLMSGDEIVALIDFPDRP